MYVCMYMGIHVHVCMHIDGDAIANGEEYFGSVSMHVCMCVCMFI
jgi:hypothetical protein